MILFTKRIVSATRNDRTKGEFSGFANGCKCFTMKVPTVGV